MAKSYVDYMNELTADDLYKGFLAHGLFCEKLPPVFSSEAFFDYCKLFKAPFDDKPKQYVSFSSMRNINEPRQFAIPNPMAYQKLCRCLADNWTYLQSHFQDKTGLQTHKISRIHIRKLYNSEKIFEMDYTNLQIIPTPNLQHIEKIFDMNYKNWKDDPSPEPDLRIGMKFTVKADIASCFPSMYTHALAWALAGKATAKRNRTPTDWFNQIDRCTQQMRYGETHGFFIGPHTSNLLSEIILTCIDFELVQRGWKFIRNVDDYICFIKTYDEGQIFLAELNKHLRSYDLLLNHKKTEILELPATADQWVYQINAASELLKSENIKYSQLSDFIDIAVELMRNNKNNAAILNYAIKILRGKQLTDNAKEYCCKTFMHLALIYPYLVPLLEENLFEHYKINNNSISEFSSHLFDDGCKLQNFEAVYFAIYYAIKYGFALDKLTQDIAINSEDCLVLLFAYKYFEKYGDKKSVKILKDHAKKLKDDDFDKYWIFAYEILPKSELTGAWKQMKEKGITFLNI